MFHIYTRAARSWTGHLHTVSTSEAAERWKAAFEAQGHREVVIVKGA